MVRPLRLVLEAVRAATCVHAFANTSPVVAVASDMQLEWTPRDELVQQHWADLRSSAVSTLAQSVSTCPAQAYILVTQPGLHASDLRDPAVVSTLHKAMQSARTTKSWLHIPLEPSGALEQVFRTLEQNCDVRVHHVRVHLDGTLAGLPHAIIDAHPRLISLDLPPLEAIYTEQERARRMRLMDSAVASTLHALPHNKYVILVSGGPDPVVADESVSELVRRSAAGSSVFRSYAFLSPGICEAIMVSLALLFVLFVAYSWLGSLRVSYRVFEAPPTLKKAQ